MLKIAICDDEAKTRKTIYQYLAMIAEEYEERFEIDQFESGDALCALIPNLDFDLIFLDHMMEGTNGLNTAKAILKSGNETTKIIFISSFDYYAKFLPRLGVIDFIDKPVEYEALKAAFCIYYKKFFKRYNPTFTYITKRESKVVLIDSIVYFEIGSFLYFACCRLTIYDRVGLIKHSYIFTSSHTSPNSFLNSFNRVYKQGAFSKPKIQNRN